MAAISRLTARLRLSPRIKKRHQRANRGLNAQRGIDLLFIAFEQVTPIRQRLIQPINLLLRVFEQPLLYAELLIAQVCKIRQLAGQHQGVTLPFKLGRIDARRDAPSRCRDGFAQFVVTGQLLAVSYTRQRAFYIDHALRSHPLSGSIRHTPQISRI